MNNSLNGRENKLYQHRSREIVWPDEESMMEGKVAFHLSLKLFLITIKIYLCKDFKSL